MGPGVAEVRDIRTEHAPQVRFAQDEQLVEALAPRAAQETLADGVGSRGADGRAQHPDPLAAATWSKRAPYLPSLSRMRNRGHSPNGEASRSCWATQASVGCRVTPTCTTRREPSAMTKKADSGRKSRSVIGSKSAAQMSCA